MPPAELLAKWQKVALIENERWKRGSEICRRACETHERNGFYSCVLMPRLAQVGDESLESRDESLEFRGGDPKDIDILCWSKDKKDGKRTIVEYVNFMYVASTKHIKPKVVRHHVNRTTLTALGITSDMRLGLGRWWNGPLNRIRVNFPLSSMWYISCCIFTRNCSARV